ncbi:hypothetical protein GCM10027169_30390 [Gordonia jinhuaensis]|uniref:Uncharacterized protein n=1 Tax=Gordonia jinhuaensis TaxID=1517702 RepID=A0A916T598_9ACTN|nr:hypothetical protein GCM10011489_20470 [Gordonia jinhuaensis]
MWSPPVDGVAQRLACSVGWVGPIGLADGTGPLTTGGVTAPAELAVTVAPVPAQAATIAAEMRVRVAASSRRPAL